MCPRNRVESLVLFNLYKVHLQSPSQYVHRPVVPTHHLGCHYQSSSVKQTDMAQFFTCDFLIYKKGSYNPHIFLPISTLFPRPPFIPKSNYIYNHIKRYTCKSKNILMTLFILKINYIYNHVKKVQLQIWKYSHDPFSY